MQKLGKEKRQATRKERRDYWNKEGRRGRMDIIGEQNRRVVKGESCGMCIDWHAEL